MPESLFYRRFQRRRGQWNTLLLAITLAPLLGACSMIPDLQKEESADPDKKFDFIERNNSMSFKEKETPPPELIGADAKAVESRVQEQSEKLSTTRADAKVDERKAGTPLKGEQKLPGAKESRYYEDFILLDPDRKIEVSMNFSSAPILDVLSAFADVLEFNFVADSDLSKSLVTLNLNSTMTKRELWYAFDQMLQMANATALNDNQLLRIMSAAKLPRQSDLRINGNGNGNSEIIFYELDNITAKDAVAQLKPFLSASATIIEGTKPNILLLCDSSDNVPKLRSIIEILDHPGRKLWPRTVVQCTNVLPSKIAAELNEILPVIGFPVSLASSKTELPGSIYLTGIDRMQLIVAAAANQEAIDLVKEWVALLDTTDNAEQERVYVYKVANSKAEQLAQALSVIFTTQGSSLTVDTSSGNNRTQQLTTQTSKITNTGNTGSATFSRLATNNDLNTTTDVTSSIFNTPVRIFADGIYNRMIIRTTPRVYSMIKALLDRLDSVPAQVLLQVLIVEINLDDINELGVEFNFTGSGNNSFTSFGTHYDELHPGEGTDTGGNFYINNPDDPSEKYAYVRALAERNKIKVISSPQILVSSNTEAQIQIGDDVPLITGSVTSSESVAGQVTNTYQYRETGIIMTLTPQVTSTNLIVLKIKQEVSEPIKNTVSTATDTPVIQQRVIDTSMTIANGRTMVMGGMIQEKLTDNLSSLPIIADIPFLSRLFGNTNQSTKRTEMLVLVTGYIVDERGKVEDMIKRYNEAVKTLSKFEGQIAETHAADMDREERLRRERQASAAIAVNPAATSLPGGAVILPPAQKQQ